MDTRLLLRIWVLSIGLALCLLCLPQLTAQQVGERPAGEVVPPTDDNANEIPPDETADSAMEENSGSVDQVVPDEPEPLSPAEEAFQRASQHEENNELDEAIADCTEAIRLDLKNFEYLIARADLYSETGEYEKSLADRQKATQLQPRDYGL